MIPKTLHFIWIGNEKLPDYAQRNVDEFKALNPDYEVSIHGEDILLPKYADEYAKCEQACQRADLLRYSVLEQEGGWYFDVDYWPIRPIDDIVTAYGLDGSKIFISNSGKRSGFNNGVIGVGADWDGWTHLKGYMGRANIATRNCFGPLIFNKLVEEYPEMCVTTSCEWINGVSVELAPAVYRKCLASGNEITRRWNENTCNQLPFAFHLWAGANHEKLSDINNHSGQPHFVVFGVQEQGRFPWRDMEEGATKAGYTTEYSTVKNVVNVIPDVAVLWNGMREDVARAIDRCERYGTNTIFCEHGFYDRQNYCQADRKGILHWSSWARHVTEPAPECGERRFNAVTNNRAIKPMSKRNGGYVLVLGQVSGDSQLNDSEVKGPLPLQRVLWPYFEGSQKNKFGLTGYFRPHPLCSNVITSRHHKTLKQIPQQCNEVRDYKKTKGGTGLKDALKGARFVITINSNAILECLMEGVPVMAFGPSIGITAGAVKQASLNTFEKDLKEMVDGWHPEEYNVRNYLYWLASRQWNRKEFATKQLFEALSAGDVRIEMEP